jgi:hypothetical protein
MKGKRHNKIISLRIPRETHEELRFISAQKLTNVSELIRKGIDRELENYMKLRRLFSFESAKSVEGQGLGEKIDTG